MARFIKYVGEEPTQVEHPIDGPIEVHPGEIVTLNPIIAHRLLISEPEKWERVSPSEREGADA